MATEQKWWTVKVNAFEVFERVNSVVAFYMFIIEESIQTVSLAIYLSNRAGHKEIMQALAQYNLEELIKPLKSFCDTVGWVGFPMNLAFKKFAEASEQAMNYYLSLAQQE